MAESGDDAEDTPAPTDRQLASTIRTAGSDSLKKLFDRHAAAIHEFVRAGVHDPNDIDDVFQEVFVTAWEKLDASQMPGQSALPWMLTTARNLVSNANRRSGRPRAEPLDQFDLVAHDNGFEAIIEAEESTALVIALQKLDPLDLKIVHLCLIKGMLYKEVAAATAKSQGVVRNRLARTRRFLRTELAQMLADR